MHNLVLYFNELSCPPTTDESEHEWSECALLLFSCLRRVYSLQPALHATFPQNSWHASYNTKPLSVWFRQWLSRDQYRWLLGILRNNTITTAPDIDIYFEDKIAIGLTCSHLTNSWAFSLPRNDSPWTHFSIDATEYRVDGDIITQLECRLKNLSLDAHVEHWANELVEWGREIAVSNVIGELDNLQIVMYPLDHGNPHIHLIDPESYDSKNHRKTLAIFRIDRFERLEGQPDWDTQITRWVNKYKNDLMSCWERCQKGKHPFRVQ